MCPLGVVTFDFLVVLPTGWKQLAECSSYLPHDISSLSYAWKRDCCLPSFSLSLVLLLPCWSHPTICDQGPHTLVEGPRCYCDSQGILAFLSVTRSLLSWSTFCKSASSTSLLGGLWCWFCLFVEVVWIDLMMVHIVHCGYVKFQLWITVEARIALRRPPSYLRQLVWQEEWSHWRMNVITHNVIKWQEFGTRIKQLWYGNSCMWRGWSLRGWSLRGWSLRGFYCTRVGSCHFTTW